MSYSMGAALGDTSQPFDLNDGANVLELKRALVALARDGTDPLRHPDPIKERVWKEIVLTGDRAGAWEGPAADELVAALSRHAPDSGIDGPYVQLGGSQHGKYGIVGGPQPTAAGLEVIAGAVQQKLAGSPPMSRYLAWRDGTLEPPSSWSGPPESALVLPTNLHGLFWNPFGYTLAADGAEPEWAKAVSDLDDALVQCWQQLEKLSNEETRELALRECVRSVRRTRHEATLQANKAVPRPPCPPAHRYDSASGQCIDLAIRLPEVVADFEGCVEESVIEGMSRAQAETACRGPSARAGMNPLIAIGAGALLGGGVWWWTQRRKRP